MPLPKPRVLLLQSLHCLERCFPLSLQFSDDESIFGFDRLVLPLGAAHLKTCAFQPLFPVVIQSLLFFFGKILAV